MRRRRGNEENGAKRLSSPQSVNAAVKAISEVGQLSTPTFPTITSTSSSGFFAMSGTFASFAG